MHNVLVTGGSRGIGLAIGQRLIGAGYNVIAAARRESDELKAAIAGSEGRLHFRACDLAMIDAIPAFAKSVRDAYGPIFGLVNNAGLGEARADRKPDAAAAAGDEDVMHRCAPVCRQP